MAPYPDTASFAPPRGWRYLLGLSGVFSLVVFGGSGAMALVRQGAWEGWLGIGLGVVLAGLFAHYWRQVAYAAELQQHALLIRRRFRPAESIPYAQIADVRQGQQWLTIRTAAERRIRLYGHPDTQARLRNALEQRAPHLQTRSTLPGLPHRISAPSSTPLALGLLIALLLVMGPFTIWRVDAVDRIGVLVSWLFWGLGLGMLVLAALLIHYLLVEMVWRYDFLDDRIELWSPLRTRVIPTAELSGFALTTRELHLRGGQPRTVTLIRLTFRDGSTVDIDPARDVMPHDYYSEVGRREMQELLAFLQANYGR